MDLTLVVMAAGMGSRFGGLKQVAAVGPNGEAIVDFSVFDAKKAGFSKVVFVIKHSIEKEFKDTVGKRVEKLLPVEYAFQETDMLPEGFSVPAERTKPWGTGHAVLCCKDKVNTPFAVINADDYYGSSAFMKIADQLRRGDDYCMVGFRLANTVTENGTVSRGVCLTENGYLKDVTEYTKIDGDCKYTLDDGTAGKLPQDTVVSMNMWGFTPDIFEYLESGFIEFLNASISAPKAEYFLPSVVDRLIKNGSKKVKVLASEDKWYGVTYKEDMETVVDAIGKMCKNGKYFFENGSDAKAFAAAASTAAKELIAAAKLMSGSIIVIGCSTSEIIGSRIGTNSVPQVADTVAGELLRVLSKNGIYLAAQCCEHLNRAVIIEKELADKLSLPVVNVVPMPKAGGSFATAVYRAMKHPVAVEHIKADAGLDIGQTLIGMHLKEVAVPVRLSVNKIGNAILTAARVRPKFIGGSRAVYDENLM